MIEDGTTVQGSLDSGLVPEDFDFQDEGRVVENGSCQRDGWCSGDGHDDMMRLARLEDSGRSKPLVVVGRLGSEVDMEREVEERNSPGLVRMPANLYTDTDRLLPVQHTLVDRNLAETVFLGSLDCMVTKADLVAAEVEHWPKSHCHCWGQSRLGNAEGGYRLNRDHTGADWYQEKDLDAIVPTLWAVLQLGLR